MTPQSGSDPDTVLRLRHTANQPYDEVYVNDIPHRWLIPPATFDTVDGEMVVTFTAPRPRTVRQAIADGFLVEVEVDP